MKLSCSHTSSAEAMRATMSCPVKLGMWSAHMRLNVAALLVHALSYSASV